MAKTNRFYNFIKSNKKHELYVYGEIIGGSNKWDETDVVFEDFKNKLNEMEDNATLDIYVNSPGGSVFTTQGIVAALRRAKDRGITVNAYIDGIGASCASWLPMVADNIYIYPQSIMMIHKPMSIAMGNSDQMKKEIEVLDRIEDDVIIPLYMERAKDGITEEFIKEKMAEETWFSANEINDIFNVTMLPEERKIACCADRNVLNRYSNVPQELLNQSEVEGMKEIKNTEAVEETVAATEVEPTTETEVVAETEETVEAAAEVVEEVTETEVEVVEETAEEVVVETEEVVETAETEPTVDEKDVKIAELENAITKLEEEKASLEEKLNAANEKVIVLNDKVAELQPIVDKYNDKLAKEEEEKNAQLLNEKREYYKNKFEQLGARAKFESEEVQTLISNCIKDDKSMSKLNLMVVDLISVENSKPRERFEKVASMDNLLEIEESVTTKYGFK